MEKHCGMSYITYFAMAQSAIRYNYCSSKWNAETGRRSIVLRLREFDPSEDISVLRPFEMVQVTPLMCQQLECSEEDENFSNAASVLNKVKNLADFHVYWVYLRLYIKGKKIILNICPCNKYPLFRAAFRRSKGCYFFYEIYYLVQILSMSRWFDFSLEIGSEENLE